MTDHTTEVRTGLLVQHAKFGLGKILEVGLQNVLVHFKDDNQDVRKLAIGKAPLTVAENQSDPRLDSVPVFSDGKFEGRSKRIGLDDAIGQFLQSFPGGFGDAAYVGSPTDGSDATGERAYKWAAHELYEASLGNGRAEALLASGKVTELAQSLEKLAVPTKMLSKFEAIALREGLREEAPATRFFEALLQFVQAEPDQARFEALAAALENLPAKPGKARLATWPVLTIAPFLARPDRFMFLKPEPTVAAALRLRFDLQYDAALRWITYQRLMTLSHELLDKLRPLGARDFIDVQSFLWVIEKY